MIGSFFAQAQYTHTISVTFSTVPTQPSVKVAPLKYNKKMAYSLTLDDGAADIWAVAYPLLAGKHHSQLSVKAQYKSSAGTNYGSGLAQDFPSKGYFYTDGCGQEVPYSVGLAIVSSKITGQANGQLDWQQLQQIYQAGWDILNHSEHHFSPKDNQPQSFYLQEMTNNAQKIVSKLGFYPTHFIIPEGGGASANSLGFTDIFLKKASTQQAIYDQNWQWKNDINAIKEPSLIGRGTVPDWAHYPTDIQTLKDLEKDIDQLMANSVLWHNDYAHSVSQSAQPGISNLGYNNFKGLMDYLYNFHGKGAADDIWVTGVQEVYEYLWNRDATVISPLTISGKTITFDIKLNNPLIHARHLDVSLLVQSSNKATISTITVDNKNIPVCPDGLINISELEALHH